MNYLLVWAVLNSFVMPLNPTTVTPYRIEAPDILTLEVLGLPKKKIPNSLIGMHLVRPDGTINVGEYGSVVVADLTIDEAQAAINRHLKPYFKKRANFQVTASIMGYNSKNYYVILRGNGADEVVRYPLKGNETVLDAVSLLPGLPSNMALAKLTIVLVRKMPNNAERRLLIDWKGITQRGITTTNYQILPGDRLFVGNLAE